MTLTDAESAARARYWDLEQGVQCFEHWGIKSIKAAKEIVAEGDAINEWMDAKHRWEGDVRRWLRAEELFNAQIDKLSDESYQLAARAWRKLKLQVPKLDGVEGFTDLPPAIQYRYALFAAEGAGLEEPAAVQSEKQIMARNVIVGDKSIYWQGCGY